MEKNRSESVTATQEDYLEAIFTIVSRNKVARNKEIAEIMGVSKATVTGIIKKLGEKGLVDYESHGYITLTEKGSILAKKIDEKHKLFSMFFGDILGLSKKESEKVACLVEHAVTGEAYVRFKKLIKSIKSCRSQDKVKFSCFPGDVCDE